MAVPTAEEFVGSIRHAKRGSAPGMSGLSYNMITEWPPFIVVGVYESLARLWLDTTTPTYWKWRWLVPIPKAATPTLQELRPLSLLEALRKIWFSVTVHRVQRFWERGGLRTEQHGFRRRHSTEEPILDMVNALETSSDFSSDLFVGSWDWKRAFDTVPKQLLVWSWIRLGVPEELAQYMVEQDIGGVTVVRSPLASATLAKRGREAVIAKGLHFEAERGVGQGDVVSPSNWIAFYDILLEALHLHTRDSDSFFTSSS